MQYYFAWPIDIFNILSNIYLSVSYIWDGINCFRVINHFRVWVHYSNTMLVATNFISSALISLKYNIMIVSVHNTGIIKKNDNNKNSCIPAIPKKSSKLALLAVCVYEVASLVVSPHRWPIMQQEFLWESMEIKSFTLYCPSLRPCRLLN